MPNIKAEATVADGVSTVVVSVDTQHHTETVPLHPTYPEGAPEEFMALDSMRRAIATVEKEGFAPLFDLQQTNEAAQRAKELNLHPGDDEPLFAFRGGRRPGVSIPVRVAGGGGGVDPIGDTIRNQVDQRLNSEIRAAATSYARNPLTAEDVRRAVRDLDGRNSPPIEPPPIRFADRLTNGRHIVTPYGAYTVDVLRTGMTIDQSTSPSLPSDEWIRSHLAHRLSQELAERLVVRNRDDTLSGYLRLEAEIIVLRRRTDGAN